MVCAGYAGLRVSRRGCLRAGALGSLGMPELLRGRAGAAAQPGPARSVIFLFIAGGVSHLDTFDPKPDAPVEVRSRFEPLETSVAGVRFTDQMPRLARQMHRLAVIRSMTHPDFQHETAWETTCSGFPRTPGLTHPNLGTAVGMFRGERGGLPSTIAVPGTTYMASHSNCFSNGYLAARHRPFAVAGEPANAGFTVRDVSPLPGVDASRLGRRQTLLDSVDAQVRRREAGGFLGEADPFYQSAFNTLSSSEARGAFDLKAESTRVRERYGMTRLGQRFLLARRLVEAGVPFVTVDDDSWDHHSNVFDALKAPDRLPQLDQAFAALIEDLAERGLLESTLVAYTTEFGRTPRLNPDAGRDHYPLAYSQVLAGGGVRGGQVIGRTDATAATVEEAAVSVADFTATLLAGLGIDPGAFHPQTGIGRPMPVTAAGRPIPGIL